VSEQAAARAPKTVADTEVMLAQVMNPADANFQGTIHGGVIMKLIDEAAGVSAYRFCRRRVVTAHIDQIDFHHPVQIGSLVTLKASVNYAGHTSVEIGVRVEAEDLTTGDVTHTNSAYLVFVALDANGRPAAVPELVPETDEEHRRWDEAKARRERRAANART
jgi:acyl-CoA hydrolase